MVRAILETLFFCGVALLAVLELYYLQNFREDTRKLSVQQKKRTFLILLLCGIQVIPFLYIFSIDFGPTDYHLWKWLAFPVIVAYAFFIWLFIKALSDLGRWWVPGQELKDDLEFVRTGSFFYVRHPMYLSLAGISVCQVFMIQNWIAGPASLILVTPYIIFQIRREERLLVNYFGDDYREYIASTGQLLPRGDKIPLLRKVLKALVIKMLELVSVLWKQARKLWSGRRGKSEDSSLEVPS